VTRALLSSRQRDIHERDVLKNRLPKRADQITFAEAEVHLGEGSTLTNQKCGNDRYWRLTSKFEHVYEREIQKKYRTRERVRDEVA